MNKNQKGFSVVEGLLILVIVGVIGGVGWYVYDSNKKAKDSLNNADSSSSINTQEATQKKEEYKIPDGYKLYENKELGFKFVYPEEYGDIKKEPIENNVQISRSSEPKNEVGPGIHGKLMIFTYSSPQAAITGRKYGPEIKLIDDKWIVSKASESDIINNKVGDVYKDFDKKAPTSQDNNGLTVYTLVSADEGSWNNRLVFVANNKLHELYLPGFSDGTYGFGEENDRTKFDELSKNIRDSIRSLN